MVASCNCIKAQKNEKKGKTTKGDIENEATTSVTYAHHIAFNIYNDNLLFICIIRELVTVAICLTHGFWKP